MTEEEKAIKRLEEMKDNYSLNGEDLHYANILYYLIINLQQEKQILKEKYKILDEVNQELNNNWNELKKWLLCMLEVSYLDLKCLQSVLSKMEEIDGDKNE